MNFKDFLNTKDVSGFSNIDKDIVRRHIRQGKLKSVQVGSRGPHLIHLNDFRQWLENVVKLDEISINNIFTNNSL